MYDVKAALQVIIVVVIASWRNIFILEETVTVIHERNLTKMASHEVAMAHPQARGYGFISAAKLFGDELNVENRRRNYYVLVLYAV